MFKIYTQALVVCTFILLIAGGLVTSTGSGLAVPDWPLSFGKLMPPMEGGVKYEHTHRMIASAVGILMLVLVAWVLAKEKRTWYRWMSIAALGTVVIQGIMGGMSILYKLPLPILIFHSSLAPSFFVLTVFLAFFADRDGSDLALPVSKVSDIRKPLITLIGLNFLQIFIGSALRHTHNHAVLGIHILIGLGIFAHGAMIMARALTRHPGVQKIVRPSVLIGFLTFAQVGLGIGALIYGFIFDAASSAGAHIFFRTAHQCMAALILAVSVFLGLRVIKLVPVAHDPTTSAERMH